MNNNERITMLANALGESAESLTLDTPLDSLENWDSMAMLSLIVMFDSQLGKTLTADQIKTFKNVNDIVNAMG